MAERPRVLIAGGGIGGITLALALRQRGVEWQLFEQAEALREVGAGIQLSANATRVLRRLELLSPLRQVAVEPLGRDYRAWDTGERLFWTPLGADAERRFGAPYLHVHRADLLDVLVRALGQDEHRIHLGANVTGFAQDGAGVTLQLANGRKARGDVLIGADGIHSTVRAQLIGREQPRYTGNVAWRGLVPAERVAHLDLGRVTGVWMGPNRSVVCYYVAAGRVYNWIGISRSAAEARESWLAEGTAAQALAEYSGWHSTIRELVAATPRLLRQALYDREPLASWGADRDAGRVTLLGDAAHAMMPFYAQGAAQSIEDAFVLAGCLAVDAPARAALARYEGLRRPRTAWMQRFSRREEELYQMDDPAAITARNQRLRAAWQANPDAFPPEQLRLYSYDAAAELQAVT